MGCLWNKLVIIPFVANQEMRTWAADAVSGATNNFDKARRLFQALTRHTTAGQRFLGFTAAQAFTNWANPRPSLTCQDFTLLFMALGRAVGLNVMYVTVYKDYAGNLVRHVCAGVVFEKKVLLLDPVYDWFGVPHQKYEFESDLQVIGAFMCQSGKFESENVGLKLAGAWALPFFWVATARLARGEQETGRKALEAGLKLDSTSWIALDTLGDFDAAAQQWDSAILHWKSCLAVNPGFNEARCQIADAYFNEGKLRQACDFYREYLKGVTTPASATKAREAILNANDELPDGKANGADLN